VKRFVLIIALAVMTLLALTPAAVAAGPAETHGAPLPGNPVADRQLGPPQFALPASPLAALRAVGPRASTINGHLYWYNGTAMGGGYVDRYAKVGGIWTWGDSSQADGVGAYSFADVAGAAEGALLVTYPAGGPMASLVKTGLVFPGCVTWTSTRSGPWSDWEWPEVQTENTDESGSWNGYDGVTDAAPVSRSAEAVPGTIDYACMSYWWDEADEWFAGAGEEKAVTAGATAAGAIPFFEEKALRAWWVAPYWQSTKPGSTVTISLENWPAGYQAAFYGFKDYPFNAAWTDFAGKTFTSPDTDFHNLRFRVPSTAKPGYGYTIAAYRSDVATSDVLLQEYVQLASFKASSGTIRRGGTVRFSGVVPTKNHWGSHAGVKKSVVIYRKYSKSGVPTKWDPTGKGWRKVAAVRCNGYGVFKTGLIKPTRSAWYVARYAGDSWYWRAYTHVVKVTVR